MNAVTKTATWKEPANEPLLRHCKQPDHRNSAIFQGFSPKIGTTIAFSAINIAAFAFAATGGSNQPESPPGCAHTEQASRLVARPPRRRRRRREGCFCCRRCIGTAAAAAAAAVTAAAGDGGDQTCIQSRGRSPQVVVRVKTARKKPPVFASGLGMTRQHLRRSSPLNQEPEPVPGPGGGNMDSSRSAFVVGAATALLEEEEEGEGGVASVLGSLPFSPAAPSLLSCSFCSFNCPFCSFCPRWCLRW
mmetsp:Transcript_55991/g.104998  ORF Transcript_55991/g.104998 Transcript_55991/m.104998 type:complete len:247 (-) Transcript_55991:148-888(-)